MIDSYKTDGIDNKYLKFAANIDYTDMQEEIWNNNIMRVLQSMILLKKALLPFCDENNYLVDTLKDGGKECKHYNIFRYKLDGIDSDVYIQLRNKHVTVFMLTKRTFKSDKTQDNIAMINFGEFMSTFFIEVDDVYDESITNLSKEEFNTICEEELYGTYFKVFELYFDFADKTKDNDLTTEDLKPFLDSILNYIQKNPNSNMIWNDHSTGINKLPNNKDIKVNEVIDTRKKLLRYRWDMSLFDLHIDLKYTN